MRSRLQISPIQPQHGLVAGSTLEWCVPLFFFLEKQGNDVDLVADAPDIIFERYRLGNAR
jgi:hypothetical protein